MQESAAITACQESGHSLLVPWLEGWVAAETTARAGFGGGAEGGDAAWTDVFLRSGLMFEPCLLSSCEVSSLVWGAIAGLVLSYSLEWDGTALGPTSGTLPPQVGNGVRAEKPSRLPNGLSCPLSRSPFCLLGGAAVRIGLRSEQG